MCVHCCSFSVVLSATNLHGGASTAYDACASGAASVLPRRCVCACVWRCIFAAKTVRVRVHLALRLCCQDGVCARGNTVFILCLV